MYSMPSKEEVGKRLQRLRGNKKAAIVSKALRITPSALSNYENGTRIPRDEIKARFANYYGVPLEEIFFLQ